MPTVSLMRGVLEECVKRFVAMMNSVVQGTFVTNEFVSQDVEVIQCAQTTWPVLIGSAKVDVI